MNADKRGQCIKRGQMWTKSWTNADKCGQTRTSINAPKKGKKDLKYKLLCINVDKIVDKRGQMWTNAASINADKKISNN